MCIRHSEEGRIYMKNFDVTGYGQLLRDWVVFSQRHLYRCPDRQDLISYGVGEHVSWGVQSHQKAFSAFAIAAVTEEISWEGTPLTRQMVLEQALAMLRYTLASHLSGDYYCIDGEKWGNRWISALGIERMFHAVEALMPYLTPEDNAALRRVMLSEADFLMEEYPIVAGLTRINNRPESNIWNGALLYRAAALSPDAPNREGYLEKARRFFANGISIESDENSDEISDGQRIGDLFVGANLFNNYACNHHGYLNVGYMVICLSNIAMLHFSLKQYGCSAENMIYRHTKELWHLIRSCTYEDGRLLRIGGDTRARYCYCQDYALPAWALVEDLFDEDCGNLMDGWLQILKTEAGFNGDGSFLSARMGQFENRSPLYYTRLESDRANVVSMLIYWHQVHTISGTQKLALLTSWSDEYHGAAFNAEGKRFASFVWRAAELPQGLLLPKNDSSLAEWRFNLSGRVHGVGRKNYDEYESSDVTMFAVGFLTWGCTVSVSDDHLAEGQAKEKIARKQIAFAALPDGHTVLCLQNAKALGRVFVGQVKGLFWNIPNDIYNKRERTFYHENGEDYLRGGEFANRYETVALGNYVNVDRKVGLACNRQLTLVRSGRRQVDIKDRENSGSLYTEEICAQYANVPRWYDKGVELIDLGFAMAIGDDKATKQLAASLISPRFAGLKTVGAEGKDGALYILAANFTEEPKTADFSTLGKIENVENHTALTEMTLEAGQAVLLRVIE